jgi:hypothetical protein
LCGAQELSESQILNANPSCKKFGQCLQCAEKSTDFRSDAIGTKLELFLATPPTPSIDIINQTRHRRSRGLPGTRPFARVGVLARSMQDKDASQ